MFKIADTVSPHLQQTQMPPGVDFSFHSHITKITYYLLEGKGQGDINNHTADDLWHVQHMPETQKRWPSMPGWNDYLTSARKAWLNTFLNAWRFLLTICFSLRRNQLSGWAQIDPCCINNYLLQNKKAMKFFTPFPSSPRAVSFLSTVSMVTELKHLPNPLCFISGDWREQSEKSR